MGFGARSDEVERERLRACLSTGVRAVDTAPLYDFHRSERLLGEVLREVSARPALYTKVGLRWDDVHGDVLFATQAEDGSERVVRRDSRPERVRAEVLASLERLGLERVELVQIHQRDALVPLDETLGALADLAHEGRVGAIGVSNFSAADVARSARALAARGLPLAVLQSPLSLVDREVMRSGVLETTREVGATFLAYSPLGQGLLTGAHGPERVYPPDDWRAGTPLFSPSSRRCITRALEEALDPIARRHGATRAQIALAWVLAQPGCAAIAGASRAVQLEESLAATRIALDPQERERLERAFAGVPSGPQGWRRGLRRVREGARARIGRALRRARARWT